MSTPGRRRALKALAKRKSSNTARVARGQKPIIAGKSVTIATYTKKTGMTVTRTKAIMKRKRGKKR